MVRCLMLVLACVSWCTAASLTPAEGRRAAERRASRLHHSSKTIQLCGRDLADVLSLVCQPYGGINGPNNQAPPSPSTFSRNGGGRARIVDECCRQPCTWRTLLSYCANFTSEEDTTSSTAERGEHEEELDNRVIEMLFGPPAPRRPRRFGKTGGCQRRCRLRCEKHAALQMDQSLDRNTRRNEIQALGTVPPDLQRQPVVVHRFN